MNNTVPFQAVAQVLLRLLALSFVVKGLGTLLPLIITVANLTRFPDPRQLLVFFSMGGFIGCGALVWVFAPAISRIVCRGVATDLALPGSLADWYSIAFVAVGTFQLSAHLGAALTWAHYLAVGAVGSEQAGLLERELPWHEIFRTVVPFILGLFLLLNGRALGLWLAAKHGREEAEAASDDPTSV